MIRVLFVDDERVVLDLTKRFLEELDGEIRVDTVLSAGEALRMLGGGGYDVVVSDYRMPGMDGLEFLGVLRGRGDRIPFIMFTGKGREEVVVEAFRRGADGYVMKGGDPRSQYAELTNWIRQAVRRRRAEEALRQSEERYRTLVELAHEGILVTEGPERRITFTNPRMAEMLGYTIKELVGMRYLDLVHPDEIEEASQNIRSNLASGKPSTYERRLLKKDGSTLHTILSISLIKPKNQTSHPPAIIIVTDITKRKRTEEREHYLHSLLRHDLGNKLQGAYSYLELLERTELSGKQGEYIKQLQQLLEDMVGLLDKVGELRTVDESGEAVAVDLDLTIRGAVEQLTPEAELKGIAIDYRGRPDAMVVASPLLRSAFINLIENSIRHSGCSKIKITLKELRDQYRITVQDNGTGIQPTIKDKLYHRGVKGSGSRGSGLGLHLTRKIIQRSGGRIQHIKTRKGTKFNIHLKKSKSNK